jgi:hypothetical protein
MERHVGDLETLKAFKFFDSGEVRNLKGMNEVLKFQSVKNHVVC